MQLDLDLVLSPLLLDRVLLLLVRDHANRDEPVGGERPRVREGLEHPLVHAADEHDDVVGVTPRGQPGGTEIASRTCA